RPLTTLEAVAVDTPACAATAARLGRGAPVFFVTPALLVRSVCIPDPRKSQGPTTRRTASLGTVRHLFTVARRAVSVRRGFCRSLKFFGEMFRPRRSRWTVRSARAPGHPASEPRSTHAERRPGGHREHLRLPPA